LGRVEGKISSSIGGRERTDSGESAECRGGDVESAEEEELGWGWTWKEDGGRDGGGEDVVV
jgi:hypothetical protein